MKPAQRRAMLLAAELETLNRTREARMRLLTEPRPGIDGTRRIIPAALAARWTPAALAGYLMGTARLDQRRRQLRALLADELLITSAYYA